MTFHTKTIHDIKTVKVDWYSPGPDLSRSLKVLKDQISSFCDMWIWVFKVNVDRAAIDQFWGLLSLQEQERARRFKFDKDRIRFIGVHGALRVILAAYQERSPESLQFIDGSHGKPALIGGSLGTAFNLSHSGDLAVIAVASRTECGIDIERVDPDLPVDAIAGNVFLPSEMDWLKRVDASHKVEAFYRMWTLKEAILKAHGEGLSRLSQVDTTCVMSGLSGCLKEAEDDKTRSIYAHGVSLADGYVSSIASCGRDVNPRIVYLQPLTAEENICTGETPPDPKFSNNRSSGR